MIKRERYIQRIRPFMGNELIKVLTGIRRSGKAVMLELIKDDLLQPIIEQFIIGRVRCLALFLLGSGEMSQCKAERKRQK